MTSESASPDSANAPGGAGGAARYRRRKRLIIAGVIVLLIGGFVSLVPTLAGDLIARFVIGRYFTNHIAHCHLEVGDCSIGWFTGLRADRVRLMDDGGAKLVDVQQIRTDLSLAKILMPRWRMGTMWIDGLDFVFHERADGRSNFSGVFVPDPNGPGPNGFRGDVHLAGCSGTVQWDIPIAGGARYVPVVVDLDKIDGSLLAASNDQMAVIHLDITGRPMHGPTATMTLDGLSDLSRMINATAKLSGLDASVWSPLVSTLWQPTTMTGTLNGTFGLEFANDRANIKAWVWEDNPPNYDNATVEMEIPRGSIRSALSAVGMSIGRQLRDGDEAKSATTSPSSAGWISIVSAWNRADLPRLESAGEGTTRPSTEGEIVWKRVLRLDPDGEFQPAP